MLNLVPSDRTVKMDWLWRSSLVEMQFAAITALDPLSQEQKAVLPVARLAIPNSMFRLPSVKFVMVHSGLLNDDSVQSPGGGGLTPVVLGGGVLRRGVNSGVPGNAPVGCHCGLNLNGMGVPMRHL